MLKHASTLAAREVAHGSVLLRVTPGSGLVPPGPGISFPREPRARPSGPSLPSGIPRLHGFQTLRKIECCCFKEKYKIFFLLASLFSIIVVHGENTS